MVVRWLSRCSLTGIWRRVPDTYLPRHPRGSYGVSIGVDGGPFEIDFRLVPDGPKRIKNRLHLDIKPVNRDQLAELDRLLALGARQVDVGQGARNWYVLADPEGNEFCLCRP